MYKYNLNNNWLLRYEDLSFEHDRIHEIEAKEGGWLEADLPCDIHMPLIKYGIIDEPLEEDNCFKCEWTEHKSWWFKKVFSMDEEVFSYDIAELTFESLDAEADIFLNGCYLGHQASAHYPFVKNVKDKLRKNENKLKFKREEERKSSFY